MYGDLPELVEQVKESLTIDKSIAGNICTMKIQYNLAQLFDKVMQKANVCGGHLAVLGMVWDVEDVPDCLGDSLLSFSNRTQNWVCICGCFEEFAGRGDGRGTSPCVLPSPKCLGRQ